MSGRKSAEGGSEEPKHAGPIRDLTAKISRYFLPPETRVANIKITPPQNAQDIEAVHNHFQDTAKALGYSRYTKKKVAIGVVAGIAAGMTLYHLLIAPKDKGEPESIAVEIQRELKKDDLVNLLEKNDYKISLVTKPAGECDEGKLYLGTDNNLYLEQCDDGRPKTAEEAVRRIMLFTTKYIDENEADISKRRVRIDECANIAAYTNPKEPGSVDLICNAHLAKPRLSSSRHNSNPDRSADPVVRDSGNKNLAPDTLQGDEIPGIIVQDPNGNNGEYEGPQ